ncbi:MAG: hypothetical protein NC308_02305 [Clostridium sp.]|nr:hypothetical protein [Bacteroides sp.]MCM1197695.1 hypothetical protein [Clostridium sp.]
MKRLLSVAVSLLAVVMLSAQEKGDMYISGVFSSVGGEKSSVNFSESINGRIVTSGKTVRSTPVLSFAPEFGYFVADRCVLRAALSYGYKRTNTSVYSDDERAGKLDNMHVFAVEPGISYYVRICNKFYYRPGAYFSFGFSRHVVRDGAGTVSSMPASFVAGLSFEPAAFEVKPTGHFGIMFRIATCDFSVEKGKTALSLKLVAIAAGFQYYF